MGCLEAPLNWTEPLMTIINNVLENGATFKKNSTIQNKKQSMLPQ